LRSNLNSATLTASDHLDQGGALMRTLLALVSLAAFALVSAGEAVIGANLELSGESAPWGQDSRNGINLALEEINAKPDQKAKLRVVFEDNKSEPSASKNAMKKLITKENVLAVIGEVDSNKTIEAEEVAMVWE